MGGYLAAIAPGLFCITGTEMNLLALQVVTNTTGVPVEYVDFIIQMAPFSIFYMACSIMMVFIIRGKERLQNEESLKTVLEERLKEMGPVSADEIKIFLVLSIGFIAFVTEQWHHLPGAFVFALVGMACFMPGMNLATEQDLRKVNLSFLIFLAACMSIGAVAQDLNIPKWISAHMSSLFEGRGAVMAISFSYVLGVIVNFRCWSSPVTATARWPSWPSAWAWTPIPSSTPCCTVWTSCSSPMRSATCCTPS